MLESKRIDWSREGGDKSILLCAPFERKDFVGLDMESRNNRYIFLPIISRYKSVIQLAKLVIIIKASCKFFSTDFCSLFFHPIMKFS